MSDTEAIRRDTRMLMFDLYGTVVDMQSGLTAAIAPYLAGKGWSGVPGRLVTWWRRTHFENSMIDALLHREHTPYREIGRRALDYTLERAGIAHTDAEVRALVDEITRLKPFPDVVEALHRLKSRYRLAILSNGDPDMLQAARPHLGIEFDHVISVETAAAFKPHVATYRKAAELVGLAPAAILFVANHAFDCVGAKAFGMRSAFVDRRKRPFGQWPQQPDLVVADFRELAQQLC
ncbi:MAG TPA: haloacid dehalogenase type II [Burkholderiales bacterium]|nr:haloacid dehalogenase type II [Burkholderiales bacterium]